MQLTELSGRIQVKFSQFSLRYTERLSRLLQKFIRQMLSGILKGGKVQLNSIARSLHEEKLNEQISIFLNRILNICLRFKRGGRGLGDYGKSSSRPCMGY